MALFTLETNSFGKNVAIKSSTNKIIKTYPKVFIANEVELDIQHSSNTNRDFGISIRRDDGSFYSDFIDINGKKSNVMKIYNVKPFTSIKDEFSDANGQERLLNLTKYFDECPKGIWQIQIFMLNEDGLAEEFIYLDLGFSNIYSIDDSHKFIDLKTLEFEIPEQKILVKNTNENLKYTIMVYKMEKENYTLNYTSKIYNSSPDLVLDWKQIDGLKSLERHILNGLDGTVKIFVMIESEDIDSQGFTYLAYKLSRVSKTKLSTIYDTQNKYLEYDFGKASLQPIINLRIDSEYSKAQIPHYRVKCNWLLIDNNSNIRRLLYTNNYFFNNTGTDSDGNKVPIIIDDLMNKQDDDLLSKEHNPLIWDEDIIPERYFSNLFNKVQIQLIVTGCDAKSSESIDQQVISVEESIYNYYLTRVSSATTINITEDRNLGAINNVPNKEDITYIVSDSDSKKLLIKEFLDLDYDELDLELKRFTINEINGKIEYNFDNTGSNIGKEHVIDTTGFEKLREGEHSYAIVIGDGINEPFKRVISFTKTPNDAPEISGFDTDLGSIYKASTLQYNVFDKEGDSLLVEEYFDKTKIFSHQFAKGEIIEDKTINYSSMFKSAKFGVHEVKIVVFDGVNTSTRIYKFNKIQGPAPTIEINKVNYNKIYKYRPIKYFIRDDSDMPLTVIELFDNKEVNRYNLSSNTDQLTERDFNFKAQFANANYGNHSIKILVDNSNSYGVSELSYSFEKINNTQVFTNITPKTFTYGETYTGVSVEFNVQNIINNEMLYDVLLDSKLISGNNKFPKNNSGELLNLEYSLNSVQFENLSNGQHSLGFKVKDIDVLDENNSTLGFEREYSYSFVKTDKVPNLFIDEDQFANNMLQIKDINIRTLTTNGTGKLTVTINENEVSNSPISINSNGTLVYSLPDSDWNQLPKNDILILRFELFDSNSPVGNQHVYFETRFIKGADELFSWRPTVSPEGDLSWSIDSSQNVPEEVNLMGPKGNTGTTPKLQIGTVKSSDSGTDPSITLSGTLENPQLDFVLPKGVGSGEYETDVESTVSVGGIPVGWKPEGGKMSIDKLIFKMLHPYKSPDIRITTNVGSRVFRKGTSIDLENFNISINSNGNEISSIKFYEGSTLLEDFTDNIVNGGNFVYQYNQTISTNKEFKCVVVDNESTTQSVESFRFINPMYYGFNELIPESNDGLTELLREKSNNSLSFNSELIGYAVYAYPKEYGNLRSITDQNGFECKDGFSSKELELNSISYLVYYNNIPSKFNNFVYNFYF